MQNLGTAKLSVQESLLFGALSVKGVNDVKHKLDQDGGLASPIK